MSKLAFDYSKWDNIEISDDEADTHPNIDKASWFRMKHRSRVEREETEQMEKTDQTEPQQHDPPGATVVQQGPKEEQKEQEKREEDGTTVPAAVPSHVPRDVPRGGGGVML